MADATEGPDVSVIVVSYNTAELLRRCLTSVTQPTEAGVEVIVVDNRSTDGSAEVVRADFPTVQLVEPGKNLGFAAGVNRGARLATGRYLLLVNPDAALGDATIDELVTFAGAHPAHGIYGGRVVNPDGSTDPRSCWGLPSAWSLFCFATGLSSVFRRRRVFDPESLGRWDRRSVREVGAVSGTLMLVARTLWVRLGGFDETYFMYSEDIDLCARAAELGARPVVDPDATATHDAGASSTRAEKTRMVLAGKATYVRRRSHGLRRRWGLAMLRLGVALRAGASRLLRRATPWPEAWEQRREWSRGYPSV